MAIQLFHPEDEMDNLLQGLSLLENAIRGVAGVAEHSAVEPDDLEPIIMFAEALRQHVRNIQRITGVVVFSGGGPRGRRSHPERA